ncbi:MAG: hypothetical protein J6B89_02700 [Bacilli bacterium]|nr:hypothetical protein [Bacilli bacterium]
MIFYNEDQTINACTEEPSLIFELIKQGYMDVVDKLLSKRKVNVNTTDEVGNDVLTRLLKAKQYNLVLKHMKKKEWDVNHQNKDGNTFAHILVTINYVHVAKIIDELKKNKDFVPNIKNNKNETILDKSINENYIYTTMKILSDKRFNNIDIISFKKLYKAYIKNSYYGTYSKLNNLEIIVDNLEKKDILVPKMQELLDLISRNKDLITKELLKNKSSNLEILINSLL